MRLAIFITFTVLTIESEYIQINNLRKKTKPLKFEKMLRALVSVLFGCAVADVARMSQRIRDTERSEN